MWFIGFIHDAGKIAAVIVKILFSLETFIVHSIATYNKYNWLQSFVMSLQFVVYEFLIYMVYDGLQFPNCMLTEWLCITFCGWIIGRSTAGIQIIMYPWKQGYNWIYSKKVICMIVARSQGYWMLCWRLSVYSKK